MRGLADRRDLRHPGGRGSRALVITHMGCRVERGYDTGVAGVHRLLEPLTRMIESGADVLVVVAGMEGALPSVVAGLVDVARHRRSHLHRVRAGRRRDRGPVLDPAELLSRACGCEHRQRCGSGRCGGAHRAAESPLNPEPTAAAP